LMLHVWAWIALRSKEDEGFRGRVNEKGGGCAGWRELQLHATAHFR
jgi:hypothetical protein